MAVEAEILGSLDSLTKGKTHALRNFFLKVRGWRAYGQGRNGTHLQFYEGVFWEIINFQETNEEGRSLHLCSDWFPDAGEFPKRESRTNEVVIMCHL
jgi:hypothetical protein